MPTIDRILFSGDILRCHDNNPWQADRMTKVLHGLFKAQIQDATGLAPRPLFARDRSLFDRERFYALCGFQGASQENWLRLRSGECPQAAREYLADCLRSALMLCHEADSLLPLLEGAGIPHIDMRIAPIRFMDDVFFAFASGNALVAAKLHAYAPPECSVHYAANRVAAHYHARSEAVNAAGGVSTCRLPPGSLLICGQTDCDSSLIQDGRVAGFPDVGDALGNVLSRYPHAFFKPHPYALRGGPNAACIRRRRPRIAVIRHNIYRLLADDNLAAVAALSSGVLEEAPYFGKQVHVLLRRHTRLAWRPEDKGPGVYIPVQDAWHSPAFWADILSPFLPTRSCPDSAFHPGGGFLRNLLDMRWGYELDPVGRSPRDEAFRGLCRRTLNRLDPSRRVRDQVDPDGAIVGAIKRFLGYGG